MRFPLALVLVLLLSGAAALAQTPETAEPAAPAQRAAKARERGYPPTLMADRVETYKTVGDESLKLWFYLPENHQPSDARPVAVFFFGGGWQSGTPRQFEPHCQHLAKRGMVAAVADYRVASRHGVKANACVADAKSAVRWIRQHAQELGVDPQRLVAGGGSAGGHLAACTGIVPGLEEASEDAAVSSVPNALVLFNPAVVLAPVEGTPPLNPARIANLRERMGVEPTEISPYHHIKAGAPPTIIFHGKTDETVPYRTVELFTAKMEKAGNRCKLCGYENQGHSFFNFGRDDGSMYRITVKAMDEFLVDLGYLRPAPQEE